MTKHSKQQGDVEFGWKIAKSMGGLDIGQSICIKDQQEFASEAGRLKIAVVAFNDAVARAAA